MTKILLLAAALAALALWQPRWFSRALRGLELLTGALGRRPRLTIALVGLLTFALHGGLTLVVGRSAPHIHDEFANLLAADTFARGRLANPAHPLAEFFEEIHVLCEPPHSPTPVRMSKYPPAQGLMLALGQVTVGQPIVGMWLSVALACAALCWAFFAWLPPRWAVLGGLLVALHPVLLKWGQVYWGGAEALLGGALVAGAFRRWVNGPRPAHGFWLATGGACMALSRPFEGLLVALIALTGLAVWTWRQRATLDIKTLQRALLPAAIVAGLYLGWQGYYNARLTGQYLKFPYMVYEERYAVAPFLVWMKPRPEPAYHHALIREHFVGYACEEYYAQQTLTGFLRQSGVKLKRLARDYLGRFYVLALPLLALPWVWRRGGWPRFALGAVLAFGLLTLQETWMWDRYAAPIGGFLFVVLLHGLRQWAGWRPGGRPLGRAVVVLILLGFLGQTALWLKTRRWENQRRDWDYQRQEMIARLTRQGGQHLILVRYGPKQSVHDDWVHNGADLDGAPVLWARDMGPEKNRRLLQYFAGRTVWLLESELPVAQVRDQMKSPPQHELRPYRE
ncbi:MAG: hypothetical protein N3J91_06185 [Verrucomicrobiae bacterium]|nr:hypothetical protein [Verrucomicrobiae bacterium]